MFLSSNVYLTLILPGSILSTTRQIKETPVPALPFMLPGEKDTNSRFEGQSVLWPRRPALWRWGRQPWGVPCWGVFPATFSLGLRAAPSSVGSGAYPESAMWPWGPLSWLIIGRPSLSSWPSVPRPALVTGHRVWPVALWPRGRAETQCLTRQAGDEVPLVSGFDLPLWGKEGVQPFVPGIGISEAFAKMGSATQNCQFSEIW